MEPFQPAVHDVVFEDQDAKVVVDEISLDYIKGSRVDFVDELIRNSFVVLDNPNSESSCGCKSSFALKEK